MNSLRTPPTAGRVATTAATAKSTTHAHRPLPVVMLTDYAERGSGRKRRAARHDRRCGRSGGTRCGGDPPGGDRPPTLAGRDRLRPSPARGDTGRCRRPRCPHRVDTAGLVPARLAPTRSRRLDRGAALRVRGARGGPGRDSPSSMRAASSRSGSPGVAGILTALAWQTVIHGSEVRAYALLALLTLVFALLLERAAARPSLCA